MTKKIMIFPPKIEVIEKLAILQQYWLKLMFLLLFCFSILQTICDFTAKCAFRFTCDIPRKTVILA